ncbi:MAG: hypothetical protein P857_110 [Candidatus Xenolissoclinum pacificiensis L6]|uniref:Msp4/OMP-like domain-containing protein n=1 Tax=Candidatus Xenolissoclinum pacificiensis L6 TaxID=1401685 RepID=W2UYT3_9RICK|nr:MAG: hypothetical protein P857_110 [Candidatus Xenolissoclinum pacificiensis L6]
MSFILFMLCVLLSFNSHAYWYLGIGGQASYLQTDTIQLREINQNVYTGDLTNALTGDPYVLETEVGLGYSGIIGIKQDTFPMSVELLMEYIGTSVSQNSTGISLGRIPENITTIQQPESVHFSLQSIGNYNVMLNLRYNLPTRRTIHPFFALGAGTSAIIVNKSSNASLSAQGLLGLSFHVTKGIRVDTFFRYLTAFSDIQITNDFDNYAYLSPSVDENGDVVAPTTSYNKLIFSMPFSLQSFGMSLSMPIGKV